MIKSWKQKYYLLLGSAVLLALIGYWLSISPTLDLKAENETLSQKLSGLQASRSTGAEKAEPLSSRLFHQSDSSVTDQVLSLVATHSKVKLVEILPLATFDKQQVLLERHEFILEGGFKDLTAFTSELETSLHEAKLVAVNLKTEIENRRTRLRLTVSIDRLTKSNQDLLTAK